MLVSPGNPYFMIWETRLAADTSPEAFKLGVGVAADTVPNMGRPGFRVGRD